LDKNWILLTIPIYTKVSLKYYNQLILKNFKLILACMLEAKVRPLVVAIPRFIQIRMPLPPLKPMAQSRCGAVIEPSALTAAKAP
jgi:hypothetical protein